MACVIWQTGRAPTPEADRTSNVAQCWRAPRGQYDSETDTLTVTLREGVVTESDEDKPGVISTTTRRAICYHRVLDASQRVEEPAVTFSTNG